MKALDYISQKYNLDLTAESPIAIPNVGRNNLATWLNELGFKLGVEVGVAAGEYSEILCQKNPKMKIYGIDPWKPYKDYRDYTRSATFASLYDEAVKRLSKYPNYVFINEFSKNALERFDDNSLDFVYIDANHKEPFISEDIAGWNRKVKPGGILSGHDYIYKKRVHIHVKGAVHRYTSQHNIKPWFVLGSMSRKPGEIRDGSRSWMWVKQ